MKITQEMLKKTGSLSQIAGIGEYKMENGRGRGTRVLDFFTGTGFQFQVLVDRGFDLCNARFLGQSLDWHSANGVVAAPFYESPGFGWLRTFPGGLVTTCGLVQVGSPNHDQNEELGLHGRFSATPAELVRVEREVVDNELRLEAEANIYETTVFGDKLKLNRKIRTGSGLSALYLDDTVTNFGHRKAPFMILYHINLGFPLVDDGSSLLVSADGIVPRDADAEKGQADALRFGPPDCSFREQVYFMNMRTDREGRVGAALVNENIRYAGLQGLGLYIRYRKDELPEFTEWKMTGCGEYVVGMEPGNCNPVGRKAARESGQLKFIEPGQELKIGLEIGVLAGIAEIERFRKGLPPGRN